MLISLHLPKTAGSSFLASLTDYYGDALIRDYDDKPINTPLLKRNVHALTRCFLYRFRNVNVRCIHGHFLPLKYRLCQDTKFVTWMRDPIERIASHYYYWLRNYNSQNAPLLQKKVVEENWTLERFCLCSQLKNFYTQFLWGFPLNKFDFIGITEYYDTELEYFSQKFFKTKFIAHSKNKNLNYKKQIYIEDKELRLRLEKFHSKDVDLYKMALKIRLASGRALPVLQKD